MMVLSGCSVKGTSKSHLHEDVDSQILNTIGFFVCPRCPASVYKGALKLIKNSLETGSGDTIGTNSCSAAELNSGGIELNDVPVDLWWPNGMGEPARRYSCTG